MNRAPGPVRRIQGEKPRSENSGRGSGSGNWGVTRFSRRTERKIYFTLTLAAAVLWLLTWLWQAWAAGSGQGPQIRQMMGI